MNQHEFTQLLSDVSINHFSHKMRSSFLNYLVAQLGVKDSDIEKHIIPLLFVIFISDNFLRNMNNSEKKQYLKSEVLRCIDEKGIVLLETPIRIKNNNSIAQRRMDSLARLFTPDLIITPCIAVAVVNKKLIITANSNKDPERVISVLLNKLAVVKSHFTCFNEANDFVKQLMIQSCDGHDPFERPREKVFDRLKRDVYKIRKAYVSGNQSICDAINCILKNDFEIIVPQFQSGEKVHHAEQIILRYIIDSFSSDHPEPLCCVGISKLCCRDCLAAFEIYAEQYAVSVRGGHGVSFFSVAETTEQRFLSESQRMRLNKIINGNPTKCVYQQCPTDSESDCEEYSAFL